MKPRNVLAYVEDMISSIDKIETYIGAMSLDEFRSDQKTVDAVVRNFEIIGEAAKRFSESETAKYPDIAWRKAAAMRDVLIHDYPEIVIDIVWTAAKDDLPVLKEQLLGVKEDMPADTSE